MNKRAFTLSLTLVFILLSNTARSDLLALFYEYEDSEQALFKVASETIPRVGLENIMFELTTDPKVDLKLDNLKRYDMVLFGSHAVAGWGAYHIVGVENDLIQYVEGGGLVLVNTNDDAFFKGGMFPVGLLMAEVNDHDLIVTAPGRVSGIFDRPNKIKTIYEDDAYKDVKPPWVVLARSRGKGSKGLSHTFQLKHGLGEYIVTPAKGLSNGQAEDNQPFLRNIINYFGFRANQIRAVTASGKLSIHWGDIKKK